MPLDNRMYSYQTADFINLDWQKSFAFLPHRCSRSNRLIWLKWAWCRVGYIVGREKIQPYPECSWVSNEEYILLCLTNE